MGRLDRAAAALLSGLNLLLAALLSIGTPSTAAAEVAIAVVEPPAEEPVVAGWDKGFFIQAPDAPFRLVIQGRLQARFTYEGLDGADDELAFSIPRARLTLKGHAFTEALTYKFQADFGRGFVTLKDFYADYGVVEDCLHVRVGQWKRPFSRQQITSSGNLSLVDRAITDRFFTAGRDIGVALQNDYDSSPTFEWALGVFNGTGDRAAFSGAVDLTSGDIESGSFSNVPDRFHPALVLRLGYNYAPEGKFKGYSEADLEGGPLRFGVAASGLADLDADDDGEASVLGELDFMLKAYGFSATGAVYVSASGPELGDQSYAATGFHLQAGHVFAGWIQPAVRYARILPDGPDNDLQEILGGLSLYFYGHSVKWQTDGGALLTERAGGDRSDWLVRTQLQLAF